MNFAIKNLYKKGSVNEKRINTDTLFIYEKSINKFKDHLDETLAFIEKAQLLSPESWARFVEQFKIQSDANDNRWRGEYWGKMMRGACFVYSYNKNQTLFKILKATVKDMLSTMDSEGRISAYTKEKEFRGWDMWCRKYVLLGLQYFMEINDDEDLNNQIISSMKSQVDYIISKIGNEDGKIKITDASNDWCGLNSSSILEPIVRLYMLTNDKKYLDFAEHIISCGGTYVANVFELAYEDKISPYQYPVTKAYEMISCFEGLLEYYRATGIEKYKEAVIKFARRLAETDITIIGSAGCTHELLDHSAARQTDTAYQGIMQETCVTVTWMKFCLQLLCITGNPEFAEYFENALYNAYLGAVNTENITNDKYICERYENAIIEPLPFDSYSSLLPNIRGRGIGGFCIMPDNHYYGCCACIGSAGIGMIHKISTMLNKNGVSINLFINGTTTTTTPSRQELSLNFKTDYPADGKIEISLDLEKDETFDVDIRIPSWSKNTKILANDESITISNGYTKISKLWKKGDKIIVSLDMRTKIINPPSNPKDVITVDVFDWKNGMTPKEVYETEDAKYHIALRRGPIILARDARLGGMVDEAVDIKYDKDGYVELKPTNNFAVPSIVEFSVPTNNGKDFTVIDYSSAGKTWREDSKYACWLPTK